MAKGKSSGSKVPPPAEGPGTTNNQPGAENAAAKEPSASVAFEEPPGPDPAAGKSSPDAEVGIPGPDEAGKKPELVADQTSPEDSPQPQQQAQPQPQPPQQQQQSGKPAPPQERPKNTCPEPSGAPICDDPNARPPPSKKLKCKLFRKKPTCDCILKVDDYSGNESYFVGDAETQTARDDMVSERVQELLRKKRDGNELTSEELHWFCEQVAAGTVLDSQIGAMLMAMYIRGLTEDETLNLTKAIIASGDTLTWSEEYGPPVDKHSTGGVGDKVSLVLVPALASLGLKVPMLSGRGLGYTGGTLDKLESIPGYTVQCPMEVLEKALAEAGCFIAGASRNIAPADKVLYSIRDVTATADCIPLVVASIVSKKVAAGSKILVMDIKIGKAAFFKDLETAQLLAKELIRVSGILGVTTKVVITKMDNPLGRGIGNALEVEDAIECMKGHGSPDLIELVTVLGGLILQEKSMASNLDEGKAIIAKTLEDGQALTKFHDMMQCQGVNADQAGLLSEGYMSKVLPAVAQFQITPMQIKTPGIITHIDALEMGKAVWKLGAGRSSPDSTIDYRVGVWLTHLVGDQVSKGDVWAEVHHNSEELHPDIKKQIEDCITIEPGKPTIDTTLIVEIM